MVWFSLPGPRNSSKSCLNDYSLVYKSICQSELGYPAEPERYSEGNSWRVRAARKPIGASGLETQRQGQEPTPGVPKSMHRGSVTIRSGLLDQVVSSLSESRAAKMGHGRGLHQTLSVFRFHERPLAAHIGESEPRPVRKRFAAGYYGRNSCTELSSVLYTPQANGTPTTSQAKKIATFHECLPISAISMTPLRLEFVIGVLRSGWQPVFLWHGPNQQVCYTPNHQ
jgi:hypothetical protein